MTPRHGDYISALPPSSTDAMQASADGCDRGSLSTWRDLDAEEHAGFVPLEVEPWRGIECVARLAWADASGSTLVVADAAHGLRVVDAADPSHLRVLEPLPLPAAPQRVLVAGSRALVIAPHGPMLTSFRVRYQPRSHPRHPADHIAAWAELRARASNR